MELWSCCCWDCLGVGVIGGAVVAAVVAAVVLLSLLLLLLLIDRSVDGIAWN